MKYLRLYENNQLKHILVQGVLIEGKLKKIAVPSPLPFLVKWLFDPPHSVRHDGTVCVCRSYETGLRALLGSAILYKINFSNILCGSRKDQRRHVGHASV